VRRRPHVGGTVRQTDCDVVSREVQFLDVLLAKLVRALLELDILDAEVRPPEAHCRFQRSVGHLGTAARSDTELREFLHAAVGRRREGGFGRLDVVFVPGVLRILAGQVRVNDLGCRHGMARREGCFLNLAPIDRQRQSLPHLGIASRLCRHAQPEHVEPEGLGRAEHVRQLGLHGRRQGCEAGIRLAVQEHGAHGLLVRDELEGDLVHIRAFVHPPVRVLHQFGGLQIRVVGGQHERP